MPRLPPVTSTDLLNAGPPVGFGPVRGTLSATARYAESGPGLGGDLDELDHPGWSSITRDGARSPGMELHHPGTSASCRPCPVGWASVRQGGRTKAERAPSSEENAAGGRPGDRGQSSSRRKPSLRPTW